MNKHIHITIFKTILQISFKCFIAFLLIAYLIKHACFYQLILDILNDSFYKNAFEVKSWTTSMTFHTRDVSQEMTSHFQICL